VQDFYSAYHEWDVIILDTGISAEAARHLVPFWEEDVLRLGLEEFE
jgi:hypothetical protein